MKPAALLFAAATALALPAQASPYGDALARCLVEATSPADKQALVRWMFATAALHPAVQPLAAVAPAERTRNNQEVARLFERLVSDACRAPTQAALKYEGPAALQDGFRMLGEVAARELFSDPRVAQGMSEFATHLDVGRIERALIPRD